MLDPRRFSLALVLAVAAGTTHAVEVYQCEDDKGNRTFESACPPGTKEVGKRDYAGATAATADTGDEALPGITLYVVPDCEACDQFREFFTSRDIPVSTKDVKVDVALQSELKQRSGELRAPTVLVGEKAIVGYNRAALIAALKESGHLAEDDTGEQPAAEGGGETEGETPAP